MNLLSLFSGIGGFECACDLAGIEFEKHFASDIEKYPNEVLQKRFPNVTHLGDITKIDFEKLKQKNKGDWFIVGGFPCQDISIAGKGKGLYNEDGTFTRSGLWFEMHRAIRVLRPRFAVVENVPALASKGFNAVLGSLAEIGYDAEWQVISAADVGAFPCRNRV